MYSFDIFFFKQKTAYEMRISDWSSDVCSSDLNVRRQAQLDHVIAVVKHKTIRETAVCANNTPGNMNVEHLAAGRAGDDDAADFPVNGSEEHTTELRSLMRNSYAVFSLKNKNYIKNPHMNTQHPD